MGQQRANWKIYQDDVKERHTTHWDLDYLPAAELEALMCDQRDREEVALKRRQRQRLLLGLGAGAISLVCAGILLSVFGSP